MPERNTPQKTLESWKQIAAYLDRSERTVRRWEASEGLPVHRREHEKQDTVFAYRHEIEAWSRLRTRCPGEISSDDADSLPQLRPAANAYLVEHDAITRTMHCYISCVLLFILPQPSPATVRESSTVAQWNTCSSGSRQTARLRISILALRASKSSRASLSCILKFNTGRASWPVPKPELRTSSPCSSAMANGRSRISCSTGTTNNP
jgi:hypothetical protein